MNKVGDIIKAPSGANVEIKEDKGGIIIVYQLDSKNERIKDWGINGCYDLIGLIAKSNLH